MDMKDYKERMVELLNEMHRDGRDGSIPLVIADAVNECEAKKEQPYLDYYVACAFYGK